MLSYNLNTTLNSYVSEQAYLPFRLPESGWVCRVGSSSSLIVIRCVENGIHCLFYRITDYSRLLFRLKHPFYKCSMLLLFFKEKKNEKSTSHAVSISKESIYENILI